MKSRNQLVAIKKIAVPILKRNGVVRAGIFGSYARGEQKKSSDVDLLVQLKKGKGMFDLVRLENELKDKLGKEVDLVTYDGLSKFIKPYVQEVRII